MGLLPSTQSSKQSILHNMNHVAFRCRDAEQTTWFYQEVLGLPLVAALTFDKLKGLDDDTEYMHLFFQMGNGDHLAFFDEPVNAKADQFGRKHSFDQHIAFEVESEEKMLEWQDRINAKGVSCLGPVDHGIVKSVYMYDPNGLQVEITCKAPDCDDMFAAASQTVEEDLRKWCAHTRAVKEAKFGAEAIDMRSRQKNRKMSGS